MRIGKKIIVALVVVALSINFPFTSAIAVNNINTKEETNWIQTKNGIDLLKTATDIGNGEYEISLKAKGNKRSIVNPVDIVMVVDKSGSMKEEMSTLKNAMGDFLDNIQSSFGDKAKVSVITFSGGSNVRWSYYYNTYVAEGLESDAQVLCDYSSNYSYIKNKFNQVQADGGTDIEAALKLANSQLNKTGSNNKKYIVFFTDGLPVHILGQELPYSDFYYINNIIIPETENYFKELGFKDKNKANFYSIGLFNEEMSSREKNAAKNFINYINNSGSYFLTDGSQNLNSVYNDIAQNIVNENRIMEDARLTDLIPKNFEVIDNAYGKGKTSIVTNLSADSKTKDQKVLEIAQPKITESNSGEELSWNLGEINYGGVEVRFKIRSKNYYYGGSGIPTNIKATIDFYDPLDSKMTRINEEFNIPKVDIPYKEGTISLSKELVDENGNYINDYKDKTFTVCLDGGNKGKYYLKVSPNGKSTIMNFYMKDTETDISNNNDLSKNYLTSGEYKIEELDSLNYDLSSIKVNGKELNKDNAIFNLDKDNKNINIVIRNIKKKNVGFNDEDKIENSFGVFEG